MANKYALTIKKVHFEPKKFTRKYRRTIQLGNQFHDNRYKSNF